MEYSVQLHLHIFCDLHNKVQCAELTKTQIRSNYRYVNVTIVYTLFLTPDLLLLF